VQDMKLENTVIKGHGPHEQIILKEVRNEQIDAQGFSYGVKTMIF